MRTKLIAVTIFLGLLISPCNAYAKELSKKELQEQLAINENQLNVLGKSIIDLESSIRLIQERIDKFRELYREVKKQKILEKNSNEKINLSDFDKAFSDEGKLFLKEFVDVHNKGKGLIVESSFFKEILGTEGALSLKFYILDYSYIRSNLDKAIAEWANFLEKTIELHNKLDAIKE